jgi:hypothetical protein
VALLPVPTMRTFVVGEYETAAYFNANIRDAINFLLMLPIATVYQTVPQTFGGANSLNAITFDQTAVDSYGGHSNTVNPSRYVAQVAGFYLVGGAIVFGASTSGTYRKAQIYVNGNAVAYSVAQLSQVSSGTFTTTVPISPAIVYLNAGDFVSLYGICDVASLATLANSTNQSYMTIIWMHA